MAIKKLPEFAKSGQKNTDKLVLEDGFPVNLKPARQWFNFLFNQLSLSINQIIDENYIQHSEIIDNLTSNNIDKPLSANQGKVLQDEKLDNTANAVSATKLQTARTVQFSGAATGSFSHDGSANSSCILTLANSGVAASTYGSALKIPVITVNAKGLITGVSEKAIPEVVDASTSTKGVVQLNNTLTSTSTDQALTANQGKKLQDEKLGKTENATSSTTSAACTGNSATSTKLQTARKITLSGAVSGDADFDGSSSITINTALTNFDPMLYAPIPYPKTVAPTGYLVMMGQTITNAAYPILYSLYGSRLPDMRAQSIRGLDGGRGIDVGRSILSEQGDAIRNINGSVSGYDTASFESATFSGASGAFSLNQRSGASAPQGQTNIKNGWATAYFDASNVVPTASENRVKNIAFNYIVKAG